LNSQEEVGEVPSIKTVNNKTNQDRRWSISKSQIF